MKKTVTKGAAQGDILIVAHGMIPRIDRAVDGLTPVEPMNFRQIVALGEATGHHHSFPWQRGVVLFRDDGTGAPAVFQTDKPAPLDHQEHSTIIFAPSARNPDGKFNIIRQRVFRAGMVRQVED